MTRAYALGNAAKSGHKPAAMFINKFGAFKVKAQSINKFAGFNVKPEIRNKGCSKWHTSQSVFPPSKR